MLGLLPIFRYTFESFPLIELKWRVSIHLVIPAKFYPVKRKRSKFKELRYSEPRIPVSCIAHMPVHTHLIFLHHAKQKIIGTPEKIFMFAVRRVYYLMKQCFKVLTLCVVQDASFLIHG